MSNNQEYVDVTKAVIWNHGLHFFEHVDTPDEVIAEALRQLAGEYDDE